MKHLRKYNESKEEISLQDVKDICQELEDEGFQVDLKECGILKYYGCECFYIRIRKNTRTIKYFEYKDVKEVLLRLRDYIGHAMTSIHFCMSEFRIVTDCKIDDDSICGIYRGVTFSNPPMTEVTVEFKIKK